jgi:hypothetical protein
MQWSGAAATFAAAAEDATAAAATVSKHYTASHPSIHLLYSPDVFAAAVGVIQHKQRC